MHSLTGSEGLASERESWVWAQEWYSSHKGTPFPLLYDDAPWPIQRRRAFEIVEMLPWPEYLWLKQVKREVDTGDREEQGLPPLPPLDESVLHAAWLQWREQFVHKYHLQKLVHPDATA